MNVMVMKIRMVFEWIRFKEKELRILHLPKPDTVKKLI